MLKSKINILECQNGNISFNKDGFVIDRIEKVEFQINNDNKYILDQVRRLHVKGETIIINNSLLLFDLYNFFIDYYNKGEFPKVDKIIIEGLCVSAYSAEDLLHFTTTFENVKLYDVDFSDFSTDGETIVKFKGEYR